MAGRAGAFVDVVAIDGPAGSGKSTVARELARRLNRFHLDTGALYRGLTWRALEERVDLDDAHALAALLARTPMEFRDGRFLVAGRDATTAIRTPEVTRMIYKIAEKGEVRSALRPIQRKLAEGRPAVAEGRDMGSVVFPDARWKFYLDGDEAVRAERRWKELSASNPNVTRAEVLAELRDRDDHDTHRAVAPLVCPPDAVRIDTTNLTTDEVIARISAKVSQG